MTSTHENADAVPDQDQPDAIMEPKLWINKGWTARVVKNSDDDGWAVEMIKDGEPEPALIGPWTMGRDKKNPKPLDVNAFNTLVKTATEVVRRHEQHMHAIHHKTQMITIANVQIQIALDIVMDEDDPHALLTATDLDGEQLAQVKVSPAFKLNSASAYAWAENAYTKPA